jgi:predicted amidophosphoribosyltransferase
MKDAFTVLRPAGIRGKTIVLVDDVMTTGATMEAAAKVVTRAGAARVIGVVFARA